ncbi:hypothetical protein Ddye_019429 [Dipteronia dyeriana]|uniref:Stigma-specific STIG1-like protein 1 n=1 Tax=Dipteronia dyeriana TaxID=168575 RepID=A0AAD9WUF0_9ROSI|nr:hypothetical protein Ddye_019429 [Dipteronia dyeriana]
MKSLRILFLVLAIMLLAITTAAVPASTPSSDDEDREPLTYDDDKYLTTSLRGASRFLASRRTRVNAVTATCDKYPRVCRSKGSAGRDCCKKKCVNVSTDKLNCGKCGRKCKYSEICCKGECVNPMNNKKHCGACNSKCGKKGSYCVYGMCSYA